MKPHLYTRRTILGATLGTIVATKLPWIGEPIIPEIKKPGFNLFMIPLDELKRMIQGSVQIEISSEEESIQSTLIKNILININKGSVYLNFTFEDVNVNQAMTAKGIGLIFKEDKKILMPIAEFERPAPAMNGDVFRICRGINAPFNDIEINKIKKIHKI